MFTERIAVVGLALLFLWGNSSGAPSVSGTSGTFSHGNSVTISGSSFGTKGTAAPLKWETFEDGVVGTNINTTGYWTMTGAEAHNVLYDDGSPVATRHGNSSKHIRWYSQGYPNQTDAFYREGLDFESTGRAYVNLWLYMDLVSGDDSWQLKLFDLHATHVHGSRPALANLAWTSNCSTFSDWMVCVSNPEDVTSLWPPRGNMQEHYWVNMVFEYKESTYNQPDGMFNFYSSAAPMSAAAIYKGGKTGLTTRGGDVTDYMDCLSIGYLVTNGGTEASTYWDDVYIDNSWARVEIGDANTYGSCHHREMQIPTSWSSGSVAISVNTGSFANGTAYLYVVDSAGAVNASGYQITVGGGATYYDLTVNSGSGDGSYEEEDVVGITADAAPSGYAFDCWVGDTAHVASVTSSSTTVTMPDDDVELTATYEATGGGGGTTLIVNWGDSSGNNSFDFSDWDNVYLGQYTAYTSDGPDGLTGGWTGTAVSGAVSGSSETFAAGDVITVTWHNAAGSGSYTFTPKISFNDPDRYGSGTAGTWYDMTQGVCPAGQSITTTYTFSGGTAGDYSLVNVCRFTSDGEEMVIDKIELTTSSGPTYYTLTVNSGSGDGDYEEDEVANISADSPPAHMQFDEWTGDTAYVTSVTSSSTTITMPADDVTVTATYTNILYALTVNSGSGDGSYAYGTNVNISADGAPAHKEFDCWVGATAGIADVGDPTTTITMPGSNATITATYTDILYALTVNSGSGDGAYAVSTNVNISADAAPSGYEFDQWVGDTAGVLAVTSGSTTLTMPGDDVEITATYEAIPSEEAVELDIASATASGYEIGNPPANAIDDSMATRWAVNGATGQWIKFDLGSVKTVSELDLSWYSGDERSYYFDIQASTNDSTYTTVYDNGESSGETEGMEAYAFDTVSARYIRVNTGGNSANTWNSIWEAKAYGPGTVEGLVSRYTFDSDASDSVGDNDGTISGGSIVSDGERGYVLSLDGTDDYVAFPSSAMAAGRSEMTLCMWVKPDTWNSGDTLWDEFYWGNYWEFTLTYSGFYTRDSSTGATGSRNNDVSMPALSTGAWQHVALVYSTGEGVKAVYVDGDLETSSTTSIDTLTTERDAARLGYASDGNNFDGMIDDVRLYGRALSEGEIELLAGQ